MDTSFANGNAPVAKRRHVHPIFATLLTIAVLVGVVVSIVLWGHLINP